MPVLICTHTNSQTRISLHILSNIVGRLIDGRQSDWGEVVAQSRLKLHFPSKE